MRGEEIVGYILVAESVGDRNVQQSAGVRGDARGVYAEEGFGEV